jgi:hypothetical protein
MRTKATYWTTREDLAAGLADLPMSDGLALAAIFFD